MKPLLLAALALLGCAEETAEAPLPLEPGQYRLDITTSNYFGDAALDLALEPDGTYAGQVDEATFSCRGTFSSTEMETLTRALEAVDPLRRDNGPLLCLDCGTRTLSIEMVAGPFAGERHESHWTGVPSGPLRDLYTTLSGLLEGRRAAGDCTHCPRPLYPSTRCEHDEMGELRICEDGSTRECDASHAGKLASCPSLYETDLQCVPEEGWVSIITWSLVEARLSRGTTDAGDPLVELRALVTATNGGSESVSLSPSSWWRLSSDVEGDLGPTGDTRSLFIGAGAEVTQWVLASWSPAPGSPILAADDQRLELRLRPQGDVPFGPPVPVAITEGL